MTKKYLLCPGPVTSCRDGQTHHITAPQLAQLYGVQMAECEVLPSIGRIPDRPLRARLIAMERAGQLVALVPRASGDYRLPGAA